MTYKIESDAAVIDMERIERDARVMRAKAIREFGGMLRSWLVGLFSGRPVADQPHRA